jgi:thiol-disulfide isomerase/thioredoxin
MPNTFAAGAGLALIALGLTGFGTLDARASGNAPTITETLTSVPAAPYDETADAHAEVAAAIARAATSHKFVLLDFGGNWCPDCRVTAGVLALPDVKPWVEKTFEVVAIDVGRYTKNTDIAERYGVRIKAAPTVIILGSDGKMVNAGNPTALKDARGMTPQAIVDTLNGWIQQPG